MGIMVHFTQATLARIDFPREFSIRIALPGLLICHFPILFTDSSDTKASLTPAKREDGASVRNQPQPGHPQEQREDRDGDAGATVVH